MPIAANTEHSKYREYELRTKNWENPASPLSQKYLQASVRSRI